MLTVINVYFIKFIKIELISANGNENFYFIEV